MARAGRVGHAPRTVVELTNADVTGDITFQNKGSYTVPVLGTTDATAPSQSDFPDAVSFAPEQGHQGTIDDLFPGAGYIRLWVFSHAGGNFVVYHG